MSDKVLEQPSGWVQPETRPRSGRNDDPRRQKLLSHMRKGPPTLEGMDPRMQRRMQFETQRWEKRQAQKEQTGPKPQTPPQTTKPEGYETRAEELKRKQDALSSIAKQEREAHVEKTLTALPDPECIEMLRGILAEHEQSKDKEAAVFKDYDFVADLDRAPAEKRKQDFGTIIDTIEKVSERCSQLDYALTLARSKDLTPEQSKTLDDASRLKGLLTEHIPDQFWKERHTLPKRRALLTATDEERKERLEQEKSGFPEGEGFADRFKEIIEPHSTKSFERTSFYFDRFVSAPPVEHLNELAAMTDKIVAKAYRIMDSGGKLADVEAMMKGTGLPEEWWPPNFIMSLQAWRKCEREFLRRDAVKLCEKNDYDFKSPSDIVKFIGDQAVQSGSSAKQMFAQILETGEVKKAVGEFTDQLKNNFGFGDDVASALEANEFRNLDPSVAKQLFDSVTSAESKLSGVLSGAVSGLKQAKKLPKTVDKVQGVLGDHAPGITDALSDHAGDIAELSTLAASFVPGLALAVAGLKLGLALAELAKQSTMLGIAIGSAEESIGRVARGELEDGFALTYALQNEQKARGVAIGKAGVQVTTSTISVIGAGAEVGGGHFGVAAKYGLEVVGKTITYGSKIVFANIEWAQADTAKDMIAEARAGNPVARIELFKNAARWAKLYIAILARDGDKTAVDFIEKNGIDETTIAGKANAIWILEEALRADSGQTAEDEVPDSWVDANTFGLLSKAKALGGAVVSGVGAIGDKVHDLRHGDERGQTYDKDWRYNGSADVSASTWRSAKDEAYGAGLHDDHGTGASDAVAKAEADYNAAVALLRGGKAKDDTANTRKIVLQAIDSLLALDGALRSWTPMSNKDDNDHPDVHAGMTEFMVRLRETARRNANELDRELVGLGIKDTNFQAAISSEPLDDKVWGKNWAGAVEKACLSDSDAGMGVALKQAMQALGKRDGLKREDDPQDWRRACLALKDALDAVLKAAEALRRTVSEVPSMQGVVERIIAASARRLREMDDQMAGDWPNMPSKPTTVSAADWKTFYDSACDGGGAKRGEGSAIGDALTRLEEQQKTIDKKADDPQKQLAAEMAFREATGKLMLASAEFLRAQRESAEPLREYVLAIGEYARAQQLAKANSQDGRDFSTLHNLNSADWAKTYNNAVDAGAVLANKKVKDSLAGALDSYNDAQATLDKLRQAKTYKDIRGAAAAVQQALGKLVSAASQAMADRGFKDNKTMSSYLQDLIGQARGLLADPALQGDAAGKAAPVDNFRPGSPTWDRDEWSRVKKAAIALGIIVDADTKMTSALKPAVEAIEAVRKQQDKATTETAREELRATRLDARKKVEAVKTFATGVLKNLSEHANWVAYANAWAKLCDNTLNSSELNAG